MMHSLAVIMARGGSKRIPRKNIRIFCGKPMVAWPVQHACESGLFQDVVISTDDPDIAIVAEQAGASLYGLRPAQLSNDYATTPDVLKYELHEYEKRAGTLPDVCCCLYGTSALVSPEKLRSGFLTLQERNAEFLMAVISYSHPIERALQFDDSGLINYRQPEFVSARTQDIKPSYHDTGLFYWFIPEAFLKHGGTSFVPLHKAAVVLSSSVAVDVDTEEDWTLAEIIATQNGLGRDGI